MAPLLNLVHHPGSRFEVSDTVSIHRSLDTEVFRAHNRTPSFGPPLGQVQIAADGTVDLGPLALPATEGPDSEAVQYHAYKEMPEGQLDQWLGFEIDPDS